MKKLYSAILICLLVSVSLIGCTKNSQTKQETIKDDAQSTVNQSSKNDETAGKDIKATESKSSVSYSDTVYGFDFSLPDSWNGYTIVNSTWEGLTFGENGQTVTETGPIISIRHPQWTAKSPRQDIPIMVFTLNQWDLLQHDKFHIGAAPIGPSELGRSSSYVFALPARYNFYDLPGIKEVTDILKGNPLQGTDKIKK